jgi:large subunit ribosomal protein L23
MADEKKEPVVKEAPAKAAAPKKADKKEAPAKQAEAPKAVFAPATKHDYEVVFDPHITEKSMALLQNANKVTVKVNDKANKTEIKDSFQRLYQVKVVDVKILNQRAKAKSRGGRYQGEVSGYKKAIVSIAAGSAVDLFKE